MAVTAVPNVRYVAVPPVWIPQREPRIDKLTKTDLRLALFLFLAGLVAVFLYQMALPAQVVVGAPLFEEAFKAGLALLPWALLRVRSLAVRLPTAWAVGGGFGWLEHALSYSEEPVGLHYGRMAFHALSAGLSILVLHGLSTGSRRLTLLSTLPSSFLHAGNNTAAMWLLGASLAGFATSDAVGLAVAALFLVLFLLATLTWPVWMPRYRRFLETQVLARLARGPLG